MAIDQAAATTAKSLLNGVDYSALIGGPLEAAIKAQATAANSTLEFITKVGFEEIENNKFGKAKNVTFEYYKDGDLQKLIVPVLVIVPIPCIEITDVHIEFMAKINASSSSTSETSKDASVNASLSGSGGGGWGPFSIKAKFSAGMSAKYSSKSSQESKYSVEYNQKVAVKAGQAGLPDGLQTILNILSSSVTGVKPSGEVSVSPENGKLDYSTPGLDSKINFELHLKDDNGMNMKNTPVTFLSKKIERDNQADNFVIKANKEDANNPIDIGFGLIPIKKNWDNVEKGWETSFETDNNGKIPFSIWIDKANYKLLKEEDVFILTTIASVGNKEEKMSIPISLINYQPLSSDKEIIKFEFKKADQVGAPEINSEKKTVNILVKKGTDRKNLTPEITISRKATIKLEKGEKPDFESVVKYIVTAEDGSTKEWTITVKVEQ